MNCVTENWSVGKLWQERGAIDESPVYQREGDVWSTAKKVLFIDSVINGFDIPKIYFNDLAGDQSSNERFAIIDGKQRLTTLWGFLQDDFPLGADFLMDEGTTSMHPTFGPAPMAGNTWSDLTDDWKQFIRDRQLSIVQVRETTVEDVEEMFERLNNGERLSGAEARNNISGDMTQLVRDVPEHDFFTSRLKVKNTRYRHREIAAKFLKLEHTESTTGNLYADLKKKYLDELCQSNRSLTPGEKENLKSRVDGVLNKMCNVFDENDPLLATMVDPPIFYVWIKNLTDRYGHPQLFSRVKEFLTEFEVTRTQNRDLPEDQQNPGLTEFTRRRQNATNDKDNIEWRAAFLTREFLLAQPEVCVKDPKRSFSAEERHAIWILGNKQCEECGESLETLDDMQADHVVQWSWGGETTLDNARCLCENCNQTLKQKTT